MKPDDAFPRFAETQAVTWANLKMSGFVVYDNFQNDLKISKERSARS